MATLFVRDLVLHGKHGTTGRERNQAQEFRVSMEITVDAKRAARSDSILDAFDYKIAQAIARHVVERENHVLIETIAVRIAERIALYPNVDAVEVVVEKMNVSGGVPAIKVSTRNMAQEREDKLLPFDAKVVIEALKSEGGISIPILNHRYCEILLEEVALYGFEGNSEYIRKGTQSEVRQQLSVVRDPYPKGLFSALRDDFVSAWSCALRVATEIPFPFDRPLSFNDLSLQKYEAGSIGITPHVDGKNMRNLICVFCLSGKARFVLCDDRAGTNPRELSTKPGNVILLRAPGFLGSEDQQFHFVTDVSSERIIFGMRQKVK